MRKSTASSGSIELYIVKKVKVVGVGHQALTPALTPDISCLAPQVPSSAWRPTLGKKYFKNEKISSKSIKIENRLSSKLKSAVLFQKLSKLIIGG